MEVNGRTGQRPSDKGLAAFTAAWVAHSKPEKAAEHAAGATRWERASAPDGQRSWRASDLIREVFGNPLRPVVFAQAWRTTDVTALARAAYETRSLPSGRLERDRLGVLADALEDAGCTEETLLRHLRGEGPHVRGCWALDLVLSRA
jgi:hypothetical protein